MIYFFLILAAFAIALLQLGALSVWFTVLSTALIAMTVVAIAVALLGIERQPALELDLHQPRVK